MNLDYLLPFLNFSTCASTSYVTCVAAHDRTPSFPPSSPRTSLSIRQILQIETRVGDFFWSRGAAVNEGKEDEMGNEKAGAKAEGMEAF